MFKSKIKYDHVNYQVRQEGYDPSTEGKSETIMNIGNGYLGIRSANEETAIKTIRNTFINGVFNKSTNEEVTELANIADTLKMEIYLDGERVILQENNFSHYYKTLDLKKGEVRRSYLYHTRLGKKIEFSFKRFASYAKLNNVFQHLEIKALNKEKFDLKIKNFIDGQVTNSGAMHFNDGEKRIYDNETMEMLQTTTQSKILVAIRNSIKTFVNQKQIKQNNILLDRRQIRIITNLQDISNFSLEKVVTFVTSIDNSKELDLNVLNQEANKAKTRLICQKIHSMAFNNSYDQELELSLSNYQKLVWKMGNIKIDSVNPFDDLAIKFAQYHLAVFTPLHDTRLGIGAKGLSGEGYKGHSFWDTEVFITPLYNFLKPEQARKLIEYRYLGLQGARKKAKLNNFKGAMYPWEAAWPTEGEATPIEGAIDIVTGKSTKIWSGFIEYHIVADIANALYQYYVMTNDQDFMDQKGYEILLDTAIFWASLAQENEKGQYEIKNVIGPNEYKEHVNNNAFTNYMAKWNLDLALKLLNSSLPAINKLKAKLKIDEKMVILFKKISTNLILLKPNKDGIIGENDSYLSLKEVPNLASFKNAKQVGTLFSKYNLAQVNQMQVSKQADLLILMLLQEKLFSKEIKTKNFHYYEKRTTHDSSLSLSTHAILAADLKLPLAYELFTKSSHIDLGKNMFSSDHGIHAASLAGMIQIALNGFGGLRVYDQNLRIEPHLPQEWKKLSFEIFFQSQLLKLEVKEKSFKITNQGTKSIKFLNHQKLIILEPKTTLNLAV